MKNNILISVGIGILCAGLGFGGGYLLTKDNVQNKDNVPVCTNDCQDKFGNISFSKDIPNEVLDLLTVELKDGKYISDFNGFNDALNACYSMELGKFDDKSLLEMIVKYYGNVIEEHFDENYTILSMTKEELAPFIEKYNIDESIITGDSVEYVNYIIAGGYFAKVEHNFFVTNKADDYLELIDVRTIVNEVNEEVDNIVGIKYTFTIDNGVYTLVSAS